MANFQVKSWLKPAAGGRRKLLSGIDQCHATDSTHSISAGGLFFIQHSAILEMLK